MPIVHELRRRHSHIVVWETNESEEELLALVQLNRIQLKAYQSLTDKRKREYLGIRACMNHLQIQAEILYQPDGKPYIKSNHHISLSHSWGKVAFIISKFPVGIDIEKNRPNKIIHIKDKFIRDDEAEFIANDPLHTNDYYHIIWGIKESLYKLHEGNFWSFLNHYHTQPFRYNYDHKIICEIIDQEHHTQYYSAYYDRIKDGFYLIYVLDNILWTN